MPQVVPYCGQLYPARQSVCGMGMSYPVRAGPAQFLGCLRGLLFHDTGSRHEKPLCHVPQPCRRDATVSAFHLEVGNREGVRAKVGATLPCASDVHLPRDCELALAVAMERQIL